MNRIVQHVGAKGVFLVMIAILVGIGAFMVVPHDGPGDGEIVVFCAAGMKVPLDAVAKAYEEEYGVRVQFQYGGSGTLLSHIAAGGHGDLYLAADRSYIAIAERKGLVDESLTVSHLTGGLAVAKGNPLGVSGLRDLGEREDIRVGLANPEAASIGKFGKKFLVRHGLWESVEARTLVFKPTVTEVANDLKLGVIDVAILWDATANQYPEIDFVAVPEFDAERKDITVAVLKSTANATAALRFARYLTARDRGLTAFSRNGYEIIDGDRWAFHPEVVFFSGAMLRPAIESHVAAFEAREGVTLNPVYNGCGILVSQMKAGERPDAYFSCDVSFMDAVSEHFDQPVLVSGNDIVILVAKKKADAIRTLNDLSAPGIRVGLCHPEKSALGALTRRLLRAVDQEAAIVDSGNLATDSATGDFLVNQLRAGSLDAAIVYRSNALASPETVKDAVIVDVEHPLAIAHQPWAVGKGSGHKQLLGRFFQQITSADGEAGFRAVGFRWELETE